ncbi:MAG: hypothetical protein K6G49_02865 [Candidatus Saccharibacteria bacterium]|nr:hypothetical protein [Candidatus Saccharibacteria bacterium]
MPEETNTTTDPMNVGTPTLPTVAAPNTSTTDTAPVADSAVVEPVVPATDAGTTPAVSTEIPAEVARKISESQNVLVALSSDPSVDEMAAAIGLSLYLDKLGKRTTAIYSGQTPNALEFLKPEETFENSADTLQDFVIALNKDKADHLRYKLDGDYVKIYITPYKAKITEEDLEFSYGDYNVDLVLALDVANGVDLDAALREHGRIMHDAVIVNITTGNPGRLGEIEWSDKTASSVSEMIARLLYSVNSKVKIEKEEATAFLTGIVAATNRFSSAGTTSETMQIASKLMDSGANQQLVSKNITPDVENEMMNIGSFGTIETEPKTNGDPTKLDIQHDGKDEVEGAVPVAEGTEAEAKKETQPESDNAKEEQAPSLLDDLKAAEASLATAGAETAPEAKNEPLKIDSATESESLPKVAEEVKQEVAQDANVMGEGVVTPAENPAVPVEALAEAPVTETAGSEFISDKPEKVIQPPADMLNNLSNGGETEKYGQMLEDALAGVSNTAPTPVENPAAVSAPAVEANPEINGVPQINYMPMPGDEVLPPPPAPPIDMNVPVTEAAPEVNVVSAPVESPVVENTSGPENAQTVVQDQPAMDPGAFKIPGM